MSLDGSAAVRRLARTERGRAVWQDRSLPLPLPLPLPLSRTACNLLLLDRAQPAGHWLGLVQGFRAVLEIERAADAAALRLVAYKLVAQVQASQGDAAAQALSDALTAATPPAG